MTDIVVRKNGQKIYYQTVNRDDLPPGVNNNLDHLFSQGVAYRICFSTPERLGRVKIIWSKRAPQYFDNFDHAVRALEHTLESMKEKGIPPERLQKIENKLNVLCQEGNELIRKMKVAAEEFERIAKIKKSHLAFHKIGLTRQIDFIINELHLMFPSPFIDDAQWCIIRLRQAQKCLMGNDSRFLPDIMSAYKRVRHYRLLGAYKT